MAEKATTLPWEKPLAFYYLASKTTPTFQHIIGESAYQCSQPTGKYPQSSQSHVHPSWWSHKNALAYLVVSYLVMPYSMDIRGVPAHFQMEE